MFKKLHLNYHNNSDSGKKPFYAPPVEGNGEIWKLKKKKVNTDVPGYFQPWNGYDPKCKLENPKKCKYFPSQTANIKVGSVYEGIEVKGDKWMKMACETARKSVTVGGGPFGSVLLQLDKKTNEIIRYWTDHNQVTEINDPTAHGEVMTIRSACRSLGVFNLGEIHRKDSSLPQPGKLSYCIIYSNAEPCPMCYSAICWANIPRMFFAATRFDSAVQGVSFSDEEIYDELATPYAKRKMKVLQCTVDNSLDAFNLWKKIPKQNY